MNKKEIYSELLENYSLQKEEAIAFLNHRVGVAVDKVKMLDRLSNNVDRLLVLCGDLKLEIRLHESNPMIVINSQKFYSTKQAAEILNVSKEKVRHLIDTGALAVKKINQRNWKVPNWSLEAYKQDLTQLVSTSTEQHEAWDVLEITGEEDHTLETLISAEGIQAVHEKETTNVRKISALWDNIFPQ